MHTQKMMLMHVSNGVKSHVIYSLTYFDGSICEMDRSDELYFCTFHRKNGTEKKDRNKNNAHWRLGGKKTWIIIIKYGFVR